MSGVLELYYTLCYAVCHHFGLILKEIHIWPKVSDSAKDLVKKMLDPNPKRRLSYSNGGNQNLTNIIKLYDGYISIVMTRGHAFVRFPVYNCLKIVFLGCFNFEDLKHDMVLQSLLQHTPMLNELELEANSMSPFLPYPPQAFLIKRKAEIFLQNVRLAELVGVLAEVEFIEFVLSSASRLESLIIKLDGEAPEEIKVYKEIMLFRRASTRVEIVILD
ncbi:hypothetical protein IEQ34_004424 [Dendrobium chrysotoxum]|uniref:FBD domain-containing protein n=1 Tax=Dendrobium chrysotoxum TaxID=161865 RepID=A0AAV7HDZ8_DENCH|nr:hypothetical protein IEQ34_004424 [Dendrobium chrysotoxum]